MGNQEAETTGETAPACSLHDGQRASTSHVYDVAVTVFMAACLVPVNGVTPQVTRGQPGVAGGSNGHPCLLSLTEDVGVSTPSLTALFAATASLTAALPESLPAVLMCVLPGGVQSPEHIPESFLCISLRAFQPHPHSRAWYIEP